MKNHFFVSDHLSAVYRGFSVLTSEASCSSYFMITRPGPKTRAQGLGLGPRPGPWPGPGPRANGRAEIIENIAHQKDAQRNSVQKDVLNSSPSFFSTSLAKKMLELPRLSRTESNRTETVCNLVRTEPNRTAKTLNRLEPDFPNSFLPEPFSNRTEPRQS